MKISVLLKLFLIIILFFLVDYLPGKFEVLVETLMNREIGYCFIGVNQFFNLSSSATAELCYLIFSNFLFSQRKTPVSENFIYMFYICNIINLCQNMERAKQSDNPPIRFIP